MCTYHYKNVVTANYIYTPFMVNLFNFHKELYGSIAINACMGQEFFSAGESKRYLSFEGAGGRRFGSDAYFTR